MRIKRIALLAGMALAAVAVIAPAAQAEWTHDHESLDHEAELVFHGNLGSGVAGVGSFTCPVTVGVILTPGSTGHVNSFTPDRHNCVGTGAFNGCTLIHDTSSFGETHANTGSTPDISFTDVTIHYEYEAETCAASITTSHSLFEELTASPHPHGDHKTLSAVTISGVDKISGVPFFGTWAVTPDNTYGLST